MGLRSSAAGQIALFRYPGVRRLFWATLISSTGTWLAVVALAIDVFDRTHSSVWVGALFATETLPIALLGFLAGPLLDRLPRRSLMIGADLFRAAVFVALLFAPNAWAIIGLATLAGLAAGLFTPAVYAGLPNLVDESDLAGANGLFQTAASATMVVGPLGGGITVEALGPHPAYLVNSASFALSALLLAGIRPSGLQSVTAASRGYLHDLFEGASTVFRSRPLLTVFVAWNLAMIGIAATNTAEVQLVKHNFGSGDFGYGLFMAATGLGIFLGAFNARALLTRRPFASVYALGFLMLAAGMGLVALLPPFALATVFLSVLGAGDGLLLTANAMLVQQGAPDELRGRSFTLIMSANALVLTVASLAAGVLADHTSARFVWALAAIDTVLAGAAGWLLARPLSQTGKQAVIAAVSAEPYSEPPLNL
ncbi:MAG: MFS transporter [Gaiellaceae bacterium]|jgi:MFS family permease